MTTAVQTLFVYRNLPLVSLTESATNPRRSFDQTALGELAESIKTQVALLKDTKIKETKELQFRAEAFNVFNHAQFNNPSGNFNNPGLNGFGYVTAARDPRIMQMALKLLF